MKNNLKNIVCISAIVLAALISAGVFESKEEKSSEKTTYPELKTSTPITEPIESTPKL